MNEARFHQAILQSPDDSQLRLVYADWLEERGYNVRAELIRLQCKLAAGWRSDISIHESPDGRRIAQILAAHADDWLTVLPKLPGVTWRMWRGMPGCVEVQNWMTFRKYATRIYKAAPVESVRFRLITQLGAKNLGASPYLERMRVLDVSRRAIRSPATLQALLRAPAVSELKALLLFRNNDGDHLARMVASCPYLANLEILGLGNSRIDDSGAMAIAQSPHLQNLTAVDLSHNVFSARTASVLQQRFGDGVKL